MLYTTLTNIMGHPKLGSIPHSEQIELDPKDPQTIQLLAEKKIELAPMAPMKSETADKK